MAEDASLDDFLDAGDDQQADTGDGDGGTTADEVDSTANVSETATDADDVTDTDDATERVEETAERAEESVERAEESVEPATATYDWTPGGATCQACADVVERRWRDDPGFVCEDCKDW